MAETFDNATLPDFWIAGGADEKEDANLQARGYIPPESAVRRIVHAMDLYGVDKRQALLVTPTTAGTVAGIRTVQYRGWEGNRNTEANRLATMIEEISGVERHTIL